MEYKLTRCDGQEVGHHDPLPGDRNRRVPDPGYAPLREVGVGEALYHAGLGGALCVGCPHVDREGGA